MILTIDQGGQGTKVSLYDHQHCLVQTFQPVKTLYPAPLHVEQDPNEVLQSIQAGFAQVQQQGHFKVEQVALSTQRSSNLCWDRISGQALTPVISWQDRRTENDMARYQRHASIVQEKSGLRLSPHYGATKLHYCLHHYTAVREALQQNRLAWGPLSSFLTFQLTKERMLLCDPTNATRTLLYNLMQNEWDEDLITLFQIPKQALPKLAPNDACFGHLDWQGSQVPLHGVQGDQSAAIFADGKPDPEACYLNIGTGAFLLRPISEQDAKQMISVDHGLLVGVACRKQKAESFYTLEGSINGAGSALNWIQNELGIDNPEMDSLKSSWRFPRTDAALFLNGVGGLGSPFWRSDFSSHFIGERTSKSEQVHAVLDSLLFLIRVNLETMDQLLNRCQIIYISGGLSQLDNLCQYLANLSQRTVIRRNNPQASSLGLLWLCGEEWIPEPASATNVFRPALNSADEQSHYRIWHDAIRNYMHSKT